METCGKIYLTIQIKAVFKRDQVKTNTNKRMCIVNHRADDLKDGHINNNCQTTFPIRSRIREYPVL